jgi:hypothetical protein
MHPDVWRSLATQHIRDLRELAANRRKSEGAGPRKVQAPSTTGRRRIFAFRRAAGRSPVPVILLAATTGPGPTAVGIPAPAKATVLNRHDQLERNAS